MKLDNIIEMLEDKRVIEEIHKHLWIESQKAGYSIGIEKATEDWLRLHAMDWLRYNLPEKYAQLTKKKKTDRKKN